MYFETRCEGKSSRDFDRSIISMETSGLSLLRNQVALETSEAVL